MVGIKSDAGNVRELNEDYASFIEKETGVTSVPGDFVDVDGNVIGKHRGVIHYTVGQRKGLGIALGKPAFVVAIRPEQNQVVIGEDRDVYTERLYAKNLNFMAVDDIPEPVHVKAKIRYSHEGAYCTVRKIDSDTIECIFDQPVRAVTPGQAVVLYDGEYVLGGGTIL